MIRFSMLVLFGLGMAVGFACSGENPNNNNNDNESSSTKDAGTTDKEGACQFSSDCKCNEVCSASNKTCEAIKCSSSSDCRCQWKCVKGACYDPAKAPCEADTDCTADTKLWKCDTAAGKCIDGGCRKNEDCTDPQLPTCNTTTHQCEKKKCKDNLDCTDPSKPICDAQAGECGPDTGVDVGGDCTQKACKLKLSCYEDNSKKLCRKTCTPGNAATTCEKGTLCIRVTGVANTDGLCLEPGPGEVLGASCAGDKKCQRPLTCAYTGKEETCCQNCQDDTECSSKESCQRYGDASSTTKLCLPRPDPCGPGRSCPGEQEGYHICSNGQCQLLLCPKQRSCPLTDKCLSSGRCAPRECPTDACEELYECKNSRCVETNEGKPCGTGTNIPPTDCGGSLVCARVGYVYSCVRPCGSGQTCPKDMTCQTNVDGNAICMQVCPAPKTCKYSSYVCVNLKRGPAGNYCVPAGQPVGNDLLEKCNGTTDNCLPDLTCFKTTTNAGYCIKNCTAQSDCQGMVNAVCTSYSGVSACYQKCPSSGSCTHPGGTGYCYYATTSTYICRPY